VLSDVAVWKRLLDLGIDEWIKNKKAEGKIKNIGFSYHGGKEEFIKILDIYNWEFTMIQYNYLDENSQAGKSGLHYAASKNIPVMIMEPLRGGMLANNLPKDAIKAFDEAYIKRTPAEWAFRWLYDQKEVICVLSGMNSMEMLKENIEVAKTSNIGDFTDKDHEVIANAMEAFKEAIKVPCTGCNYCMPCPQGVDIPTCLSCYNNINIEGKLRAIILYLQLTSMKSKPHVASLCNNCGKCEKMCPQKIEIRKELKKKKRAFEKFYFKAILFFIKSFMRLDK
jgi:predicted aldo/keto reductase-like oxidoreductase